jgi:SAM-dependent methyltransferase
VRPPRWEEVERAIMAELGAGPGQPRTAKAYTRERLDALLDSTSYQELALLYIMAKLNLADALRDGPQPSSVLARMCAAHPDTLRRVLRALASLALLSEEADGRFGLAPLGRLLRSDVPDSLRDQVVLEWEVWTRARDGLLAAVRTGESGFSQVFGHSLYEHLAQHPDLARTFDAEMVSMSLSAAAALLAAYDFSPASRIVDVGGGAGALLAAILQGNPLASGIVFDLPAVAEGARAYLAAAGLGARCEVVAGDFFSGGLPHGDTYVLSHVLHNWDGAHCTQILQNCRAAMPPDGRIVIFEHRMPERITQPERAVEFDISMLVLTGGRQRTEAEYRKLLGGAGLELTRVVPTASPRWVFEGRLHEAGR